jgi:hypothetical protein
MLPLRMMPIFGSSHWHVAKSQRACDSMQLVSWWPSAHNIFFQSVNRLSFWPAFNQAAKAILAGGLVVAFQEELNRLERMAKVHSQWTGRPGKSIHTRDEK